MCDSLRCNSTVSAEGCLEIMRLQYEAILTVISKGTCDC